MLHCERCAAALRPITSAKRDPSFDRLPPIERVGPGPGMLRLIETVPGTNKIVRRDNVVCRVRDHAAPSVSTRASLYRTHHAQLQAMAAVPSQHTDTRKIAGIVGARRRNHARKTNRDSPVQGQPPIALIEFRNRRAIKECKPMKLSQRIQDFLILLIEFDKSCTSADPWTPASSALPADMAW